MIRPFPLATDEYPFPHLFVRSHYSEHYLASQVPEENVQESILQLFRAFSIEAIAIDAGGRRERGRMIRRAKVVGIDLAPIAKGSIGSEIPSGHSDLAGTLAPDGRSLFVEVKAPAWIDARGKLIRQAGRPTREQLDFLAAKYDRGAICIVAYSIDDVANYLGARLQRNLDAVREFGRTR